MQSSPSSLLMQPPLARPLGLVLGVLLTLTCSSCLSFTYTRTLRNEPVELVAEESPLAQGASLASCLDRLGAPTYVFEDKVHGLMLVWSWTRDRTRSKTSIRSI